MVFGTLLCAARRFLTERGKLDGLNPASARALGLLPDSKWGERLDLVIAGGAHGVFNGLWIGPGANRFSGSRYVCFQGRWLDRSPPVIQI